MKKVTACILLVASLLPLLSTAEPFILVPVAVMPARLKPGESYEYVYNIEILEDGFYAVAAATYVGEMNTTMLLDLDYLTAGTNKTVRGRVYVPPNAKPGPVFVIFYIFYDTESVHAVKNGERGLFQYAVPVDWSYIPDLQVEASLAECKSKLDELSSRCGQQQQDLNLAFVAAAFISGLAIGYMVKRKRA